MAGKPILTQIEEKMAELISNIDTASYNFVWSSIVNERDLAKRSFPSAVIYFEDEGNVDDQNGTWSQAYYNEVIFRIEVRAKLSSEYENPIVEIRKELYKCLDDLKMLFGTNWNLDYTCDTIMYKSGTIVEEASNDIFIPSRLVTKWLVRYEQDRQQPTVTAQ
jgi:hypothetical protein